MDYNLEQLLKVYRNAKFYGIKKTDSRIRLLSEKYIETYWLSNNEMADYWLSIKDRVFRPDSKDLPHLMFNEDFELISQIGGDLFTKEEYHNLQQCMKAAGDRYFVLIENEFVRDTKNYFPHLRYKFPVDTTWEMLNNGSEEFLDISYETLFVDGKNFFVFGDSGKWGKYSAYGKSSLSNHIDTPVDIIGFKPELAPVFQEYFKQPEEDIEEIWERLPESYKTLIKPPAPRSVQKINELR